MAEGITKNCLQQINNIYKSRPKKGRKICQSSDTGTEWFTWFVSLKEGKQRKGRTTQEPDWNEWQQILNHHQYGRMISGRYSSEYQQSLVPKAAFQLLDFRIVQTLFLASKITALAPIFLAKFKEVRVALRRLHSTVHWGFASFFLKWTASISAGSFYCANQIKQNFPFFSNSLFHSPAVRRSLTYIIHRCEYKGKYFYFQLASAANESLR